MVTALNKEQIQSYLEKLFWDYDIDKKSLYGLLTGSLNRVSSIDRNKLYARILTSLDWYTVLKIIPGKDLKEALSDDVMKQLFPKDLRARFEYARKFL